MKLSCTRFELKCYSILTSVVVYWLKIIGLAPFSLRTRKSHEDYRRNAYRSTRFFLFSKIGLVYNILLLFLVPLIAVLKFPHLISLHYTFQSPVTQFTDIAQGILCVLTVWVIIMTWSLRQREATCIMNKLLEVDVKLSGLNEQRLSKIIVIFSSFHVTVNFCLWLTIWAIESVQPVISDTLVNWCFFTIPSFVIYSFIVEYLMVVGLVARKMESVNECLSDLKSFRNNLYRPSFVNEYSTRWSLATHRQLDTLYLLHNIHTGLFELCQEIEEFFSFPILPCVAYSFSSLVYNIYYLITPAFLPNGDFSITGTSTAVAWISISLYPLTLLFYNIEKIAREAELTGKLVHKLLRTTIREEMTIELRQFSLQLLHENFNFTAYGFFTLDFTLLHSMLGATATYIFILIQFQ